MSSVGNKPEATSGKRVVWRSLEQKADPSRLAEDACGSDVVKQTLTPSETLTLRRRSFVTLSGAITMLAGIEGCVRRPVEKIMPYTEMPEYVNPGMPMHYATVTNDGGEALGLVVTTHEGRPTKVEGNPDHPTSLGATSMLAQASILDLYDPERARSPKHKGADATFAELDAALTAKRDQLAAGGGNSLRVLADATNSPTFMRARKALLAKFPNARVHTYSPLSQSNVGAGIKLAFGRSANVLYDFSRAKVILALDSDFLGGDPGSVLAARQFAMGRDMESSESSINRLYAVEPLLTNTGSTADHRLRMPAQDVLRFTKALANQLATAHRAELGAIGAAVSGVSVDEPTTKWITAVAKDLAQNSGDCVVVVGPRQPAEVHALAYVINRALGNTGRTINFGEAVDPDDANDLATLVAEMNAGKVETLLILGGNPVYDAPADLQFGEALKKVATSIHCSGYDDETAALCTWLIPRAHELESWGDQMSSLGHYSVQQPMIAPLWGGRTDAEVLGLLAGIKDWRGYEQVHATVEALGINGEIAWRELLHKGLAAKTFLTVLGALSIVDGQVASALAKTSDAPALGPDNLELVFAQDPKLFDGRHANNTWLLEMPDPLTRIVWDNAALIAPSTARQLGIENGDLIKLTQGERSIEIPAWLQPGVAAMSVTLNLGWGRKRAGKNGNGKGFDVYPLRTSSAPYFVAGAKLEKIGKGYKIVQTQEHDTMRDAKHEDHDRPLAIDATLSEYKERPNFPEYVSPDPAVGPLWETQDYSKGQQWGMVVDLNTCTGCSTCVIACQAENNVPVVGKEQVSRGREMHWFRIDRYYVGENEDEPEVAFQPIGCQHCEEAPCENVCPVAATSHSPEGLNDIAYNRCIGTRYCMNNCPYKVRRFNFLNFNLDIPETRQMAMNPNVTVRFRGVIEKCSYCVQRIQGAKIAAKRDGRREVRDGEVKAACQQACPSQSISFGDLNDPNSDVSKKGKRDRNYALLAEIGTRPRTRFLGKVRNPNPEMIGEKS